MLFLKTQFGVKEDGFINIRLSRQDLASFTGATYETVFRVINDLLNDRIVEAHDKYIKVIDKEKLLSLTAAESF